jgi:hypothetical protein
MYPPGDAEFELGDQCAAETQEPENKDREDRGPIAGVHKRVAEAALVTPLTQVKKTRKEPALSATGTTALQSCYERRDR